jgi:hypothetical protein
MTSRDDHLAVADAIEALAPDVRAELAEGPLPDGRCRICATLSHLTTEDAETILDFHELDFEKIVEAATRTLGTDQRMSNEQEGWATKAMEMLGSVPDSNVKVLGMARNAIECLADNLTWQRCLYVYLVAGWKP